MSGKTLLLKPSDALGGYPARVAGEVGSGATSAVHLHTFRGVVVISAEAWVSVRATA